MYMLQQQLLSCITAQAMVLMTILVLPIRLFSGQFFCGDMLNVLVLMSGVTTEPFCLES